MTDKETAKDAWMRAYRIARGGNELTGVTKRDAEGRFERWWRREVGEE